MPPESRWSNRAGEFIGEADKPIRARNRRQLGHVL
nr:MAG TPA: hypothetical protein [Caudoviricetes sp.]